MEIEIKSVKLSAKSKADISYVQTNDDGTKPKLDYTGDHIAHDDFNNVIQALAPHYALLTGCIGVSKGIKLDAVKQSVNDFHVSGYSIGGKDEDQGIVITGHRIVPASGMAVIMNSPFTRFNVDEEKRYKFMDDLILAIEDCREEAKAYMDGKAKKDIQGDLFVNEGGDITKEGE